MNIVDADIAFITSISLDHIKWLGSTLSEIAHEKIAICKNARYLISTELQHQELFLQYANRYRVQSYFLSQDFEYIHTPNNYVYKEKHFTKVLSAVLVHPHVLAGVFKSLLVMHGTLPVDWNIVERSMRHLVIPARCQAIEYNGYNILLDVAHNVASAQFLKQYIDSHFSFKRLNILFSCSPATP